MIYDIYSAKINPNDYDRKPFNTRSASQGMGYVNFMNLYRDIKKNGIKYPILMESVKGKSFVKIGMQRVAIASKLKLKSIDAVVYSTNGKIEIDGLPIKELNDIVRIYGSNIIGEPVFLGIIDAIIRTYKNNSSSISN
tara:strand:+ start:1533 stop:1946 length:414 start_codon:yes stop_codon:yes gene_type:complete